MLLSPLWMETKLYLPFMISTRRDFKVVPSFICVRKRGVGVFSVAYFKYWLICLDNMFLSFQFKCELLLPFLIILDISLAGCYCFHLSAEWSACKLQVSGHQQEILAGSCHKCYFSIKKMPRLVLLNFYI